MKPFDLKKVLNYAMGSVFTVLGITILAGWLKFQSGSPGMKNVFGVVLILYGIYKFTGAVLKNPSSGRGGRLLSILFLAGLLGLSACSKVKKEPRETVTSGKRTVIVSESHKRLFSLEASEFMRYYEQARITVLGASTREAIVNLLNDSVKVVVTDRKLNAEERAVAQKAEMFLEEISVAEDAVAVLVNKVNGIETISQKTLKAILTGRITRWEMLPESRLAGPVSLIMTGRNSGLYELIRDYFFKLDEDLALSVLASTQDSVLEATAMGANAIGLVSIACFKDTAMSKFASKIKPLAFAGIDSSTGEPKAFGLRQDYVYFGTYPLHYSLYMIRNTKEAPLATGFITFVSSTPGQKILMNWGLVPKKVPVRFVQLTQEEISQ